jgi:hypothetical protein
MLPALPWCLLACATSGISIPKQTKLRHTGESRYPVPLARCFWPLDPGLRRDDEIGASYPRTIPASQSALIMRSPRPLRGVLMRRREAGRGAAPAGSCTQHGHSGGIGAPPGTNRSPCQELTDRPAIAGNGKRGPVSIDAADWRAERRPPCPATDADTVRFALFGAPPPR